MQLNCLEIAVHTHACETFLTPSCTCLSCISKIIPRSNLNMNSVYVVVDYSFHLPYATTYSHSTILNNTWLQFGMNKSQALFTSPISVFVFFFAFLSRWSFFLIQCIEPLARFYAALKSRTNNTQNLTLPFLKYDHWRFAVFKIRKIYPYTLSCFLNRALSFAP